MRWFAVGLVLSQLGVGEPALAQGSASGRGAQAAPSSGGQGASSAADVEKLYNQGVAALKAQQWEKARARLREAFKIEPLPQIAANLGHAEFMSGSFRDAAEHLSFFLREEENISAADRKRMEKQLADARARIGTVTVRVNVEGAKVLVDGQEVGVSPIAVPVFVEPGRRVIEAKKEGLALGRESIVVTAGAEPIVELTLSKIEQVGVGPRVDARAGAPLPESEGARRSVLIGAGVGVTVALAAAGAAMAIEAVIISSNKQLCTSEIKCLYDNDVQRADLSNMALWTSVGAGVTGGATLLYYIFTGKSPAPQRIGRASLMVDVQGGGVVVKGHF